MREKRFVQAAIETGEKGIVGFPIVFGALSVDLGGFRERVSPGAVAMALGRKPDVIATVNHEDGQILGRTGAGTLRLEATERGLRAEIPELPDTSYVRDLRVLMARGDVHGMSFAFDCKAEEWGEELHDGQLWAVRTLNDITLHDVAIVTRPAYPATEVALRSLQEYLSSRKGKSVALLRRQLQLAG